MTDALTVENIDKKLNTILEENKKISKDLNISTLYRYLTDELTKLPNKNFFNENIITIMLFLIRDVIINKSVHSFLFCDIDGLKLTNDTLGYDAGDEGIFTVSDVIKKHTRYCDRSMTDILLTEPKEHSWAFRYGGDEFVIILPNCTKEDAEKFVADRIKKSIKLAFKDSNIDFSISIGIVDTRDPNMYIPFSIADEELKAMYKSLIKKSSELMKIDKKASKDKRIAVMGALNRLGETLGINPYDNDELKILTDEMYRIGSEYNNKYSKNK